MHVAAIAGVRAGARSPPEVPSRRSLSRPYWVGVGGDDGARCRGSGGMLGEMRVGDAEALVNGCFGGDGGTLTRLTGFCSGGWGGDAVFGDAGADGDVLKWFYAHVWYVG